MKYLVMECHPGYAVVLDDEGRFWKVANMGYEVGETVDDVIKACADADAGRHAHRKNPLAGLLVSAACFCLVFLGVWQYVFASVGTVRMQINPDVLISVNRLNYVVGLEGLNRDGERLADGVHTFGRRVDEVSDELADRALEMNYLSENGKITLTVYSSNKKWKKATEEKLILELNVHLPEKIHVEVKDAGEVPAETAPETDGKTIVIPVNPNREIQKESAGADGVFYDDAPEDDDSEDVGDDREDDDDSEDIGDDRGDDDHREDIGDDWKDDDDSEGDDDDSPVDEADDGEAVDADDGADD